MQEFVIHGGFWDHDLIIVSESQAAASRAFLNYLSARDYLMYVVLGEWIFTLYNIHQKKHAYGSKQE